MKMFDTESRTAAAGPPTGHEVRRGRAALLILLGGLSAMAPFCIDMYLPALPRISAELHSNASSVQTTLTACLVGLGVGQLIGGPISDVRGRRGPLLVGMTVFALASLVCAFAPSVGVLVGARLVQGLAGSTGIVIANAVVRDLFTGDTAARYYSRLMVISALGPVLAPIVGAQLLRVVSWRGIFVVLAVLGAVFVIGVLAILGETLPAERRVSGSPGQLRAGLRSLVADRTFVGVLCVAGIAFGTLFAYISGSPYLLQGRFGASAQLFSLLFALNAIGIATAGWINGRVVGRVRPQHMLSWGIGGLVLAGAGLLVVALTGTGALVAVCVPLFVLAFSIGLLLPNCMTLGVAEAVNAGSAASLIGLTQYVFAGIVAPFAGISNGHSALPMAVLVTSLAVVAVAVRPLVRKQEVEGSGK
ncbi:multidrug effflux MFS transporter [Nocardia terpenica]